VEAHWKEEGFDKLWAGEERRIILLKNQPTGKEWMYCLCSS
jgi:hypothetical protein